MGNCLGKYIPKKNFKFSLVPKGKTIPTHPLEFHLENLKF